LVIVLDDCTGNLAFFLKKLINDLNIYLLRGYCRLKELFYRIRGRRNFLLKTILILTLLALTSFVVVLLPQLINPHILSKHLSGFSGGAEEEISTREYFFPDAELFGQTSHF